MCLLLEKAHKDYDTVLAMQKLNDEYYLDICCYQVCRVDASERGPSSDTSCRSSIRNDGNDEFPKGGCSRRGCLLGRLVG